jgi:hypothetical protein
LPALEVAHFPAFFAHQSWSSHCLGWLLHQVSFCDWAVEWLFDTQADVLSTYKANPVTLNSRLIELIETS